MAKAPYVEPPLPPIRKHRRFRSISGGNILIEQDGQSPWSNIRLTIKHSTNAVTVNLTSEEMRALAYSFGEIVWERHNEVPMDPSWGSGYKRAEVVEEVDEADTPASLALAKAQAEMDARNKKSTATAKTTNKPPPDLFTRPAKRLPKVANGCEYCDGECTGDCV